MRDDSLSDDEFFACDDCRVNVKEIDEADYMLTTARWQEIGGGEVLCIGCIECRLGRELTPDDFSHCPNNRFGGGSERLASRRAGKIFLEDDALPRAMLIDEFLRELGVSVEITTKRLSIREDMHCDATFRRRGREWTIPLPTNWETAGGAATMLILIMRTGPTPGYTPDFARKVTLRRVRAAVIAGELFSPQELTALKLLSALPPADHVLPERELQRVREAWARAIEHARLEPEVKPAHVIDLLR